MQSTLSVPLLPGRLSPGVVVLIKIRPKCQMELFIYSISLKQFNLRKKMIDIKLNNKYLRGIFETIQLFANNK